MFTAYITEDAQGAERVYMFMELPEDVEMIYPYILDRREKPAIGAMTRNHDAIYEVLPGRGNWDNYGQLYKLSDFSKNLLLPKDTLATCKTPGGESRFISPRTIEELIDTLQIKPHYLLLRYHGPACPRVYVGKKKRKVEILTPQQFEDHFRFAAELSPDYPSIEPDYCLCQVDVEAALRKHSITFKQQDRDYYI